MENKEIAVTQQESVSNVANKREQLRVMFNAGVLPSSYLKHVENNKVVIDKEISEESLTKAMGICIYGETLNLSPYQALTSLANINGKMQAYGDAIMSIVLKSGLLIDYDLHYDEEKKAGYCRVQRKGFPKPIEAWFSIEDAKQADLFKSNVWCKYPKRMCQMRARGFILREMFADILGGAISEEEANDYPVENQYNTQTIETHIVKPVTLSITEEKRQEIETDINNMNCKEDLVAYWSKINKELSNKNDKEWFNDLSKKKAEDFNK